MDYMAQNVKCPECNRPWTAAVYANDPNYGKQNVEIVCNDCKIRDKK